MLPDLPISPNSAGPKYLLKFPDQPGENRRTVGSRYRVKPLARLVATRGNAREARQEELLLRIHSEGMG
jgi:hypothetical protein